MASRSPLSRITSGLNGILLNAIYANLAIIVIAASTAQAEHRVFELMITDTSTGQSRTVTSTLDDLQYATYYPIKKTETIKIESTWMCWNRSDQSQDLAQRFCPNPRGPASVPQPAPATSPTTGPSSGSTKAPTAP